MYSHPQQTACSPRCSRYRGPKEFLMLQRANGAMEDML
jgi:hypothetical protein